MLRQPPAAGRIPAGQDEFLAVGDNPWTDREGAQRMGLPYVLVGHDPCAHFQSLAQMMRSRRLPRGPEPMFSDGLGPAQIFTATLTSARNAAETDVTSLSPGRAIVLVRRDQKPAQSRPRCR